VAVYQFRFSGPSFEKQEIDLYSAGRFMYASARLFQNAEHLRLTGSVPKKLNQRPLELKLTNTAKGSFIFELAAAAGPQIANGLLSVSIEQTLMWTMAKLFPAGSDLESKAVEHQKALDVVDKSLDIVDKSLDTVRELSEHREAAYQDALKTKDDLIEHLRADSQKFYRVEDIDEEIYLQKARIAASDMCYPLKRKDDWLSFSNQETGTNIISLDRQSGRELRGTERDNNETEYYGIIIEYNSERYSGIARLIDEEGYLSENTIRFTVNKGDKDLINDVFFYHQNSQPVFLSGYAIRNVSGLIAFLALASITADDD
jgi:hypothetical protein